MKPHHRIFFIQFAVALSLGAFVSRLPDLQLKFSLTEGELGLLLAVMSSGVRCGLTVSVRFIERLGARTTAFVTVFGASLFFALIPWMPSALLCMDPVIDRFNPRPVAITLLGIAAIGVVMVATATHPVVALAGFGLTGVGCSSVYPLAISAAARRTDRPAPVNVAALGQTTFLVFFAGPPLLGFVAEHFGIRFSYWAVVPVLAAALLVTWALAADPAPVTGQPEPAQPHG
ncbi:MFS transporter [Rhizobium leguminosarum]|uniref:MFS transporter n=1 Tax=Rhizobium leguminosarum TaxID=384 RepID=UPI000FEC4F15|nr:MFS transporter [Rhizobium leguminosarum]RWX31251.1 MFS transporter [Rhizobium leguminosarum]